MTRPRGGPEGAAEADADPHPEARAGALDPRAAALVALSAELATGPRPELEAPLREAAAHAGPGEVEEALLQAHLFVGFPPVLEAFRAWRRLAPPPGGGTDAVPAEPGDGKERRDDWRRRGERVCGRVYGSAYDRLRDAVAGLHPDLDRWMVEDGYGKVLGRPGLDLRTRELCIVALLAVGSPRGPLHSHLRGALRVGARPEEVGAALEAGLRRAPDGDAARVRRERVLALWRRVREGSAASREAPGPARAASPGVGGVFGPGRGS